MTLKQYVDSLQNILGGFVPSDDARLLSPQLDFWFNYYRAKLIPQMTNYGKEVHPELLQDLGWWELEVVDKGEDSTLEFGKTISRFVKPIPEMVQLPMNRGIWISSTDKQESYTWTDVENARYKIQNPFAVAGGIKWCYMIGQVPYVLNCCNDNMDQKWVNLRGVLTNPLEGNYYYSVPNTGIAFNRETTNYPINPALADAITKMIIQVEFNTGTQTDDSTNNASWNAPILKNSQTNPTEQ